MEENKKSIYKPWSETMKEYSTTFRYSPKEMAAIMRVHVNTYRKWEKGQSTPDKLHREFYIKQVLKAFELDLFRRGVWLNEEIAKQAKEEENA